MSSGWNSFRLKMDFGVVAGRGRRIGRIGWISGAAPSLDHAAGRSPIVGRSCARPAPSVPTELTRARVRQHPRRTRGDAARRGSDLSFPKFDSASGVFGTIAGVEPGTGIKTVPRT